MQRTLLLDPAYYVETVNEYHAKGWKIVPGSVASVRIEYNTESRVVLHTKISVTLEKGEVNGTTR